MVFNNDQFIKRLLTSRMAIAEISSAFSVCSHITGKLPSHITDNDESSHEVISFGSSGPIADILRYVFIRPTWLSDWFSRTVNSPFHIVAGDKNYGSFSPAIDWQVAYSCYFLTYNQNKVRFVWILPLTPMVLWLLSTITKSNGWEIFVPEKCFTPRPNGHQCGLSLVFLLWMEWSLPVNPD